MKNVMEHGVKVMTGNDSITDHRSTFSTRSALQKANLAAQLYGFVTETNLLLESRVNINTTASVPYY